MACRVLVIGNCQAVPLARCMGLMAPDLVARGVPIPVLRGLRPGPPVDFDVDHILYNGPLHDVIKAHDPVGRATMIRVPRIIFRGYHPDMISAAVSGQNLPGLHSAIALWGFKAGMEVDDIVGLYNEDTYRRLGYFEMWDAAKRQLIVEGQTCNLDIAPMIEAWARPGQFMHTLNHPALRVLASLAEHYLAVIGVPAQFSQLDGILPDPLRHGHWGTYPELAAAIGCPGQYAFTTVVGKTTRIIGLRDFVQASLDTYRRHAPEDIDTENANLADFGDLVSRPGGRRAGTGERRSHPYAMLPDHRFWRKAVAGVAADALDPVVATPFTLKTEHRIATAGSCFAQHIANTLRQEGFNFLVSEPAPADLLPDAARQSGYGLFSARFGNIYTARQLVQLFDRAYGNFVPEDEAWQRPDGRYADPFRPQVEPAGFASVQAVREERTRHLDAVRRMFEDLNVFIFTLGLTEGWRSLSDGAVFPLAPGVAAGEMDPTRYEFVNFTTADVVADLTTFLDKLKAINPTARAIFTVSPVPLVATYEDRHVLVSTACSKAILRSAVDEVCRAAPQSVYFPSFEIITGHYNKGAYFEADLRSVTPSGVAHVMRVFTRHFTDKTDRDVTLDPLFDVICDEERLDA